MVIYQKNKKHNPQAVVKNGYESHGKKKHLEQTKAFQK